MTLKTSINDAKKFAEFKNALLVSKEYINANNPLKWECSANHKFSETFSQVKRGRWCKLCKKIDRESQKLEKLNQFVNKKYGGFCLSNKFHNTKNNLTWKCKLGHTWDNTPEHVKRGRWCAKCRKDGIKFD